MPNDRSAKLRAHEDDVMTLGPDGGRFLSSFTITSRQRAAAEKKFVNLEFVWVIKRGGGLTSVFTKCRTLRVITLRRWFSVTHSRSDARWREMDDSRCTWIGLRTSYGSLAFYGLAFSSANVRFFFFVIFSNLGFEQSFGIRHSSCSFGIGLPTWIQYWSRQCAWRGV